MATIIAGDVVTLSPLVRRLTAPNPGPMTGPGTNTYLVGRDDIAVIDPGPAIDSHISAILAAGHQRIKWIIATHTHPDHSPAAKLIAEATGAMVMGNLLSANDGRQDDSFAPHAAFSHNQLLATEQFTLRAILTPGHVGNHVCFLLEDEGLLFTGDHIMQGSTVVIVPPYGDMSDYIASLQLLKHYAITAIAPGHGSVIDQPAEEIDGLIRHRLKREAKVVAVIQQLGEGSLQSLTPLVYDDVAASLHPIAEYSLWAHLIKLQQEERVEPSGERWLFKK